MLAWARFSVTPMASASMEVATARGSMAFQAKESSQPSSSFSMDSRIMLPPMNTSSPKAIQWLMEVMREANRLVSTKPITGIAPWKPPNQPPTARHCFGVTFPTDRPLQIDTAKASMLMETAISSSSKKLIRISSLWKGMHRKTRLHPFLPARRHFAPVNRKHG